MQFSKSKCYEDNVLSVKQYGEHIVKVSMLSKCRISGIEDEPKNYVEKNTVNTEKLVNNLARAKSKVRELILCNDWDFWCTFTISPEKYDRYNLKAYFMDFAEFIHNTNKRRTEKVKYLFIPEMHQDNAWHIHGFIANLQDKDITVNQNGYLTWTEYDKRFGYMSMSKIQDKEKCSSYALKYMTKDSSKNVSELGAHLYYASQKLKVATQLYKGQGNLHCDWDWVHPDGYCRVKTFDTRYTDIEEFIEVLE